MQMASKPEHLTELKLQEKALELIQAGLQSGSIRLKGCAEGSSPNGDGKHDAAYLNSLLSALMTGLSQNKKTGS